MSKLDFTNRHSARSDSAERGPAGSGGDGAPPTGVDRAARVHDMANVALRCALPPAHLAGSPVGSPERALAEALRGACDAARESGLRAEQLLLIFKEGWRYLPEAQRLRRQDAEAALARVITLCIHEYYGPERREG